MNESSHNIHVSKILTIIAVIVGSLSVFLLAIILLSFIKSKKYTIFSYKLLICLFVSVMIVNLSYIVNLHHEKLNDEEINTAICQIQGTVMLIFDISQYGIGALISINTNLFLTSDNISEINPSNFIKISIIILGYIFPIFFGAGAKLADQIKSTGHWCFLNPEKKALKIFLICILLIFSIINLIFTIKSILYLKNLTAANEYKIQIKNAVKDLIVYPIIQILYLFVSIGSDLIVAILGTKINEDIGRSVKAILYCSEGLWYALAFGFQFCRSKKPVRQDSDNDSSLVDDALSKY